MLCIRHLPLIKNATLCVQVKWSIYLIGATVKFEQTTYTVSEVAGSVKPVLVLSNPSSTAITVEVFSTNGSATGKQCLSHASFS